MNPIEPNQMLYWIDNQEPDELPESIPPINRPDVPVAGFHWENEYHQSDLCLAERL